jgi:hypothetical protein
LEVHNFISILHTAFQGKNTVLISGLHKDCDEEYLKLLFENKEKTGGGPIEDVDIDKSRETALITFTSVEGVISV